jgi:hypothetical protein
MAKDTKTSAKSSGDSRPSARTDKASGADPVASSGDEAAADEEAASVAADKSAAAAAEAAAADKAAADKAAADKAAADKAAADKAAADKATADKAAADKAAAAASDGATPPATEAAAATSAEPAALLGPERIDRSVAPSTPAPPPGVAPAGDARSLRRTRGGIEEFCLIYRLRSLLIRRQGVVGTLGEWTITDYPSLGSASHAYAQECSDLTGDGFIDIRG